MTTADDPGATPPADELQFDHAEFEAAPALACAACAQPIAGSYYEANGSVLCAGCRDNVVAHLDGGSGMVRFLRAGLFGSLAALAGAALYLLVAVLTNTIFALIAILIGFMVGTAVRKGSRGRGGWLYQALAVFLTYTALIPTYLPLAMAEFPQLTGKEPAADGPARPARPPAELEPKETAPEAPAAVVEAKQPPVKPARQLEPGLENLGAGKTAVFLVVGVVVLTALGYAAPIWYGAHHLITLLIIFFGLQQAWRLNKKVPLAINGPYQASGGGPPTAEVPAHA